MWTHGGHILRGASGGSSGKEQPVAQYVVTRQGKPVAILQPYTEADAEQERQREMEDSLAALKKTAREVARAWTSPKTAVEILDEQRR